MTADYMTQTRISVRSTQMPGNLHAMFHRFDAARFEFLAQELRRADRPEIAKLAEDYAAEHRATADNLELVEVA